MYQGIMQGMLFYKTFQWIDNKFNIQWFAGGSEKHRKEWTIRLFGKDRHLFEYWPLIMFTDAFHFSHGMFGMLIGEISAQSQQYDLQRLEYWIIGALGYSCVFELQLRLMKKLSHHEI